MRTQARTHSPTSLRTQPRTYPEKKTKQYRFIPQPEHHHDVRTHTAIILREKTEKVNNSIEQQNPTQLPVAQSSLSYINVVVVNRWFTRSGCLIWSCHL